MGSLDCPSSGSSQDDSDANPNLGAPFLAERGKRSTRIANKKRFCKLDKTFFFILVLAVFCSSLIIAGQSLGLCHFDAELSVARNPKPCSVIITTLIKPFYSKLKFFNNVVYSTKTHRKDLTKNVHI